MSPKYRRPCVIPMIIPSCQPQLRTTASFLVTGDDDLLELKSFSGVEIVSVRAFAERLQLKI
jgi:hypothetical protein